MVGKNDGYMPFRVYRVFLLSLKITLAALCAIPVYALDCNIEYNSCKVKADITCRVAAGACTKFKAACDSSFQTCNVTEQNRRLSIDKARGVSK